MQVAQDAINQNNEFSNDLNLRKFNVSGNAVFANGTNSISCFVPNISRVRLWQLTERFKFQTRVHNSSIVYENTPSALAKLVCFQTAVNNNCVQFLNPHEQYYDVNPDNITNERVYAPSVFDSLLRMTTINRDMAVLSNIIPYREGDRIYAAWNRQSAKWEALLPPVNTIRFQLLEGLTRNGTQGWQTASAKILYFDISLNDYVVSNKEIIVVDFLNRSGTQAGNGGYAKRFSEMSNPSCWEIITM